MSDYASSVVSNALPGIAPDLPPLRCGYCLGPFTRRRSWQLYCSTACRNEAAARKVSTGMRGIVSSVRVMKRGSVSVVLRFGLEERERVLKLEPGKIVGVEVAT